MSDLPDSVSTKPYLIRAIYDWAVDCELTPQVLVAVDHPEVEVPVDFAKDGQIVLNLHPQSVRNLEIGAGYLMFSARFAGKPFDVVVPVDAVMAIYARENGQGIVFQADGSGVTPPPEPENAGADKDSTVKAGETQQGTSRKSAMSHLKLVK
ncbi:MAG: ClpXP protease specificity-enhancing factor [Pseudomonadota bacterium]